MNMQDAGMDEIVGHYVRLLDSCKNNDRSEVERIVDFLGQILRLKRSVPPPVAEFVTVLKHRKPLLHVMLKKMISPASPIHFVLHLDMNYEAALERLGLANSEA